MSKLLLIIWGVSLVFVLVDWAMILIERRKISKMSQLEKMVYMTEKYGRHWQNYE
jgi:hypothetical protein